MPEGQIFIRARRAKILINARGPNIHTIYLYTDASAAVITILQDPGGPGEKLRNNQTHAHRANVTSKIHKLSYAPLSLNLSFVNNHLYMCHELSGRGRPQSPIGIYR